MYLPTRVALKKLTIPSVYRNSEQEKPHTLLVEMQNSITTLKNSLVVSYKGKHILTLLLSNLTLRVIFEYCKFRFTPKPTHLQQQYS